MSDITIRPVIPEDAADILAIYSYYVEKTAITFELEVPSLSEFQARIAKTLTKYDHLWQLSEMVILSATPMQVHSRIAQPMTILLNLPSTFPPTSVDMEQAVSSIKPLKMPCLPWESLISTPA